MIVTTVSGSKYKCKVIDGILYVSKDNHTYNKAIALFPDRLPHFENTVKWEKQNDILFGYNNKGVRTLKFNPEKVSVGMIFADPYGFRSTPIKHILT